MNESGLFGILKVVSERISLAAGDTAVVSNATTWKAVHEEPHEALVCLGNRHG